MQWQINEEDTDDFEQERAIQAWIKSEGPIEFDFKHITSKGTARNTLVKASFSLDQKMSDDTGSGTFADRIVGSDGRDLVIGDDFREEPDEVANFKTDIEWLLACVKSEVARVWATANYSRWFSQNTKQES